MKEKEFESDKEENEDEKQKNSRLFKTVVIFLLIVIIILLLIQGCGSNIRKTNLLQPSGDFDIIEINCTCETCKTDGSDNSSNNSISPNKPASSNTDFEPDEDEEGLIVYDRTAEWSGNYIANMFTHASYEIVDGKIAPGSTNVYKFIVKNMNPFKVKYKIDFKETNLKNIPMKFRLKKENSYIIGSSSQWVDATSLAVAFNNLNAKSSDVYYLEWKWFHEDSTDFSIGVTDNTTYKLEIKVYAEEI